ncbi:hypothetical protein [Actinacidiphila soli]|uniref:hypothetical protein n=1 Tax=Actinacidiphila soli TaxID=2487275 RepID=UPI000FCCD866|nr:hypothetical protein [Actinacidiphila soli]
MTPLNSDGTIDHAGLAANVEPAQEIGAADDPVIQFEIGRPDFDTLAHGGHHRSGRHLTAT